MYDNEAFNPWSENTLKRFWSKVDKQSDDECWLWKGTLLNGYGVLRRSRGKLIKTHRLSWFIHYGMVQSTVQVQHLCNVRSCVNPNHLTLGNTNDNMKYMALCGRACKGQERRRITIAQIIIKGRSNIKLNVEKVKEVRQLLKNGEKTSAIAKIMGVSDSMITRIKNKARWGFVDDEC
jgi:HNH endonuclease